MVRHLRFGLWAACGAAALMLLTILPSSVFANGWLGVKLVLVVAYIVLGSFALKRGRTPRIRAICYASAALVFALVISIARSHQPYGFLLLWFT